MNRSSTIFLQFVIALFGIGVAALMLWFPNIEGRNAHATPFQVYFQDPALACAYLASIPFFVALYQAFKLLGLIAHNEVFSPDSVRALRIIKYCALSLVGFLVAGEAYLFIVIRGTDDIAGGVMTGLFLIFVFIVVVTAAATFERILQNAVDIKSEHDLTV